MFWQFIRLLRPTQWVKNFFLFGPLLFADKFRDRHSLLTAALGFLLFCLASSVVYILNDLRDLPSDRQHPVKSRKRPLASGSIRPGTAWIAMIVLEATLLSFLWFFPMFGAVVLAYQLINVLYSFKLKQIPVIDIFCVAAGFVLRVYAGALIIVVPLSLWMLNTVLCLSLFLAVVKRRQELAIHGSQSRDVLSRYSLPLLDRYANLTAVTTIIFYCLFATTVRHGLVLTIPLVLFGFFRYLLIIEQKGGGESPTDVLLTDWPLIATILLWLGLCLVIFCYPDTFATLLG